MTTTRPTNGRSGTGKLMKMPRRTIRVEMEGDYEGYWIDMWSNPPLRLFLAMQDTNDFSKLEEIIHTLVIDWNLTDFEGEPIPVGAIQELGMDMVGPIVQKYMDGVQRSAEVPKSPEVGDNQLGGRSEAV